MSDIALHLLEDGVERQTTSLSYFLSLFVLLPADYICFLFTANPPQGQIHVCVLRLSGVCCLIELMTVAKRVFQTTCNSHNLLASRQTGGWCRIIMSYKVLASSSDQISPVCDWGRRIISLFERLGFVLCKRFICGQALLYDWGVMWNVNVSLPKGWLFV